ncbi:MAG TPA: hypothetical protein VKT78_19960 [Fimbriimonadaceae bacterium]|nr:hypothetical protein [Fimbriimonadaceae bacterium]
MAFCDGEYHPNYPKGNPFISTVGISSSNDGGLTWTIPASATPAIEGLDVAQSGQATVAKFISGKKQMDSGASGPTAVVQAAAAGPTNQHVYLLYADRVVMAKPKVPSGINVARALLSDVTRPGAWEKWQGSGWGPAGTQTSSKPVVLSPGGKLAAVQPNVTWNKALNAWLMVFRTAHGLYATSSTDLVHWGPGRLFLPAGAGQHAPSFPTLLSPASQGTSAATDANGILVYSVHDLRQKRFIGYFRTWVLRVAKPPQSKH